MIDWLVIGALTACVTLSFFKDNIILRIVTVIVMLAVLIGRELSIDAFARSLIWSRHSAGLSTTAEYKEGALAILDYCKSTRIYVVVISVLLIILSVRGFRKTKPPVVKGQNSISSQ